MASRRTTKKSDSNSKKGLKSSNSNSKKKSPVLISMGSLSYSGIEIYKTKDKNIEQTSKNEEKEGFILQNGTITEIAYYNEIVSDSFEHDYEDISSNGSVNMIKIDAPRFYKGKKILLKKGYNATEWNHLKNCLLGFITEQTFSEDGVEIKIAGASKLLEQEKKFTYKKTKISKILKDMITSAGLKAKIDTTGLNDKKVDYTNVSSSGSSNASVSGEIAEVAVEICKNCTTDLEKAKAIWKYCHDNIKYQGYSNSKKGADKCFKDKSGNCCDHANVVVKMLKAVDVECAYEHSTSCYSGRGHVWAVAKCDGEWYSIDASVKSKGFNQVGENCTGTRKESLNF